MIDETVDEIEEMQTHSSSEVALKALDALESVSEGEYATVEEYLRSLERNARTLRHANRSHATLFATMHAVANGVREAEAEEVGTAKSHTLEVIEGERQRITSEKTEAAERAIELIEPGGSYLTLDFSSTLLEAFTMAAASADPISVYALEARPRWLGRKFARRVSDVEGVEAHLAVDNAAGYLLDNVDRVLVGMTCIVEDTLYNRVGTYPLAATANHAGVPMHAVGARSKVVEDTFVFENEQRPASEVSLEPLDGVHIDNPAYDATPVDLLTSVLTDEGTLFESG